MVESQLVVNHITLIEMILKTDRQVILTVEYWSIPAAHDHWWSDFTLETSPIGKIRYFSLPRQQRRVIGDGPRLRNEHAALRLGTWRVWRVDSWSSVDAMVQKTTFPLPSIPTVFYLPVFIGIYSMRMHSEDHRIKGQDSGKRYQGSAGLLDH